MMRPLLDWVDSRTGIKQLLHEALYENIPCGARWRYITGSMLVFAFVVQTITGLFLWMAYSPSSQTAYESVYFIQHEVTGGWLLRGVHHFMAQAMVVVMGLHLLQVIIDGAYRAPREVNYWLGLILMQLVMGLGLTGYLLPWDQKGYWATNVATNLMTLVPFVGKELQALAVGGSEYGHHTLTRFFAMHAGVLPAALLVFLALHIAVFRKHGITAKITPGRADQFFWPQQVLLDAIGCLVLLGIVLLCVIHWDVPALLDGKVNSHYGAELGAPADPSEQYSAARPEWYYLFLFQLLKYFHGTQEVIGALVIPGVAMTILALLPFIGRSAWGHRFSQAFILLLILAAGVLTGLAIQEDSQNKEFLQARRDAEENAQRTIALIGRREALPQGKLSDRRLIQRQGAVYLLRNDPLTQGPKLFKQHCASCHSYNPPETLANYQGPRIETTQSPRTKQVEKTVHGKLSRVSVVERDAKGEVVYDPLPTAGGAPNLFGFATRDWIKGLLDKNRIDRPVAIGPVRVSADPEIARDAENPENHKRPLVADYFGFTGQQGGRMAAWVKSHAEMLKDDVQKSDDAVDAIAAALSAQARLRGQAERDHQDERLIARGVGLIQQNCARGCHRFGDTGQLGLAPDLTGYGSYEWMLGFVSDPGHERFYRMENDRMPAFAADLAHPENHSVSIRELSLIVDWLRGDYYLPDAAAPVLPHTEEYARQAVAAARTVAETRPAILGAAPPISGTLKQRVQNLFRQNCAACHNHTDAEGRGVAAQSPSAPNLFKFASREWLTGLFDPEQIAGPRYFGLTSHSEGDMASFVKDNLKALDQPGKEKLALLIAALSAEAALPAQAAADKQSQDSGALDRGRNVFKENFGGAKCADCHKFRDAGEGTAPTLTGYGSREWLVKFISNPTDNACYGEGNDRMPAFGQDAGAKRWLLSPDDIDLLVRWLRGEPLE